MGGLNDVLRNRDYAHGLRPTLYAFGDLGGLTYLDTRASYQRKQTSINYAISNRNHVHRMMVTHSTGLNKKDGRSASPAHAVGPMKDFLMVPITTDGLSIPV